MNCFSLLLFFLLSGNTSQEKQFVKLVSSNVEVKEEAGVTNIKLPFEILNGYHIQPEQTEDNLIATQIEVELMGSYKLMSTSFIADNETIVMGKNKMDVVSNKLEVNLKIKTSSASPINTLRGRLYYQACDKRKCYFPRELLFEIQL